MIIRRDLHWYLRRIVFLILGIYLFQTLAAQVDSLEKALEGLEDKDRVPILETLLGKVEDFARIPYLLDLSKILRYSDPDHAFVYAQEARRLSEAKNDSNNLAIAYSRIANIYFTPWLKYDSALWAIEHTLNTLGKGVASDELGRAYNLAGIIHADQGDFEEGIKYFEEAEHTFQTLNDNCWATTIHHNIGKLYKYSNQFGLAKQYFYECLDRFQKYNCPENYDYLFVNLGGMYEEEGNLDEALNYFQKGLRISQKLEHHEGEGAARLMIGKIYRKQEKYDTAQHLFMEALAIANSHEINKLKIASTYEYAILLNDMQRYEESKIYILKGLGLARKFEKLSQQATGYELLHDYYLKKGKLDSALINYKWHIALLDSIEAKKVQLMIAGLETEKKENQIQVLNRENEIIDLKLNRSKLINYMLLGVAISGLLVFYLLFRNYRHRQRVRSIEMKRESDRKILDMERRILASVIETENRERKRFAADLHDGLGPLLSSVKLYLGEILDTKSGEQIEMVEQASDILDYAIRNTREISRNIVPATLTEKGLKKSLQEFCSRIERIGHLQITIDGLELENDRLNPGLEVVLFRILTELINNTVKHAEANKIDLAVRSENSHIVVNYGDDGVGFEVGQVLNEPKLGMGLHNIIDRIKSLHGTIDIDSRIMQGTTIKIEIPV